MKTLTRTLFSFIFLSFLSFHMHAQEQCATMEVLEETIRQNPALENSMAQMERDIQRYIQNSPNSRGGVITIPVVVHVVHGGEAVGQGSNISDNQVLSQIPVLNEDFRRTNADRVNTVQQFQSVAADMGIEFCLATQDPSGNTTTGILRHNYGSSAYSQSYIDGTIKPQTIWNRNSYLNIWVAGFTSGGLLGYATLPGGSSQVDGVVVNYRNFGRYPANPYQNNNNRGRTTTHEVGHYLGLYHTFQGGCGGSCSNSGDYVCDTPPTDYPNYGCPTTHASCGDLDMVQNYMDYSNDACMNLFSEGQKARVLAVLNGTRASLQNSTGCQAQNLPPVAEFTADITTGCSDLVVTFTDQSDNSPTNWNWSFPGGIPSSSTAQNPVVTYPNTGSFNVSLLVSNSYGNNSTSQNGFIQIDDSGLPLPFAEDFENGFGAQGWGVANSDGSITWSTATVQGSSPGNTAASIDFFNYDSRGQRDGLLSPVLNFSGYQSVTMTFDYAHRRYNSNHRDSLVVYASSDCGQTFTRIVAKAENGQGSFATGYTTQNRFVPAVADDWCFSGGVGSDCFDINLDAFAGESSVVIRFEGVNDYGNNLYIDNINIDGEIIPCTKPIDLTVVTDANGTNLSWTSNSQATSYQIRGKILGTPNWTIINTGNNLTSYTVQSAPQDKYYEWEVQAVCSNDNSLTSGYSQPDTFGLGCVRPMFSSTTDITSNSAVLNWSSVDAAGAYHIRGRVIGSNRWISIDVGSNVTNYLATNLPSSTNFEWQVKAICNTEDGTGSSYTNISAFTTTANNLQRLAQSDQEAEIALYPNPVSSMLNLVVPDMSELTELSIFDAQGRIMVVVEPNQLSDKFSNQVKIDVRDLTTGVYFINYKLSGKNQSERFIKVSE